MNARDAVFKALKSEGIPGDDIFDITLSLEIYLSEAGFVIMSKEDVEAVRDKALEEAAAMLRDGSYSMPVSEPWRNDGQPSKHDKCKHGATMYEDCIECAAAAIRSLKSGGRDGKEARE